MKIRALVPFSTGTITMEKYEIREVSDAVGAKLVAAKLVTEISGGGGGSDALVVTDTDGTLDKTWQEIHDAFVAGSVRIQTGTNIMNVKTVGYSSREGTYDLACDVYNNYRSYSTDSASGYPSR